jgi:hypothetical protein
VSLALHDLEQLLAKRIAVHDLRVRGRWPSTTGTELSIPLTPWAGSRRRVDQ